jgi:folate-binding protein YgfZ
MKPHMQTASITRHDLRQRFAVIAAQGEDAAAFLQGQTTCDVRQVSPEQSSPGALCSAKGRVIANFQIMAADGGFLLLLRRDLLDSVLPHLRRYVLRAKVELSDASAQWRVEGLIGAELAGLLAQAGLALADTPNGASGNADALAVRLAGEPARCLLLQRSGHPIACLEALPCQDDSAWQLADIANGLPWVDSHSSEAYIPQMLNLDLLGAVSFQKGCYTGQEIVARTHYLGQSKRRTYRYQAPLPCQAGDPLYAPGLAEAAGSVVNAAAGQLLAVVACEQHNGPLHLGSPDGPLVQVLPLPYPIAATDN